MSESVAELLERAADIQEQRGFCQHNFSDDAGHVCLTGSLALAAGLDEDELPRGPSSSPAFSAVMQLPELKDAARAMGFESYLGALCSWNNEWGRTGEQVVARLREGARTAREQEPATA